MALHRSKTFKDVAWNSAHKPYHAKDPGSVPWHSLFSNTSHNLTQVNSIIGFDLQMSIHWSLHSWRIKSHHMFSYLHSLKIDQKMISFLLHLNSAGDFPLLPLPPNYSFLFQHKKKNNNPYMYQRSKSQVKDYVKFQCKFSTDSFPPKRISQMKLNFGIKYNLFLQYSTLSANSKLSCWFGKSIVIIC